MRRILSTNNSRNTSYRKKFKRKQSETKKENKNRDKDTKDLLPSYWDFFTTSKL